MMFSKFKASLKENKACSFLESWGWGQEWWCIRQMRLNLIIMTELTRAPEPEVIWRQHGRQNATRIYLGHPCKGRLYHLIMTLLKQQWWFRVATWWDRSYGKGIKTTRYKSRGGNLTYMLKLTIWGFSHGLSKVTQNSKKCPHTRS